MYIALYNSSYSAYTFLIKSFNFNIANEILKGYSYNFGFNLSSIEIIEMKKHYTDGDRPKRFVNWGDSLKLLKEIIKEKDINLYEAYINKDIKKYEFIELSKKYTYSPLNPDRKKWIIYYTDDYMYVWHWSKGKARIANSGSFSFVPTNYIVTTTRSQLNFVNQAASKEDILNTNLLGMRDKLNCLLRYDKGYYLKFRHDL